MQGMQGVQGSLDLLQYLRFDAQFDALWAHYRPCAEDPRVEIRLSTFDRYCRID
jgi:hypothetical protein